MFLFSHCSSLYVADGNRHLTLNNSFNLDYTSPDTLRGSSVLAAAIHKSAARAATDSPVIHIYFMLELTLTNHEFLIFKFTNPDFTKWTSVRLADILRSLHLSTSEPPQQHERYSATWSQMQLGLTVEYCLYSRMCAESKNTLDFDNLLTPGLNPLYRWCTVKDLSFNEDPVIIDGIWSVRLITTTETAGICSPCLHWHRWGCREMERCICPQSLLWKVSNPLISTVRWHSHTQKKFHIREPADIHCALWKWCSYWKRPCTLLCAAVPSPQWWNSCLLLWSDSSLSCPAGPLRKLLPVPGTEGSDMRSAYAEAYNLTAEGAPPSEERQLPLLLSLWLTNTPAHCWRSSEKACRDESLSKENGRWVLLLHSRRVNFLLSRRAKRFVFFISLALLQTAALQSSLQTKTDGAEWL